MVGRLHLDLARHALARGGVVAYPTESVWGLGCDPLNGYAFDRLRALKRRPLHKGVILIAAEFAQLEPFLAPVRFTKLGPVLATWPGPHTWLLPARANLPHWLTGGRETIAVRVTAHPVAAALCRAFGGALVSTSANVSGRPPARTALQLRQRFGQTLDFVLAGPTGGLERPTPIRDGATGKLLRS